MLDKMSARCTALSVDSGPKKYIDGACVLADADGDKIFSTFDTRDLDKSQPEMDCGTHIITGGTAAIDIDWIRSSGLISIAAIRPRHNFAWKRASSRHSCSLRDARIDFQPALPVRAGAAPANQARLRPPSPSAHRCEAGPVGARLSLFRGAGAAPPPGGEA